MVPAGVSSFVSSQTSGLRSYNIINIAVHAFLCTLLFMLYLDNISYFRCRETRRALNVKGSEGGGCRWAWGGIAGEPWGYSTVGAPSISPPSPGVLGPHLYPQRVWMVPPLPKGIGLRGGAVGMGLRLPAAISRQA